MISSQDFLDKWNTGIYGLVYYDEKFIEAFSLSQETKVFLMEAGFPESAPPFLTFVSKENGGGERVTEKNNKLAPGYRKFLKFGFTGSGFPICLNECNSELVYIDFDKDNKIVLINSSISKFAETLLVYVEFIKEVKAINGKKAYLEKNATEELLDWIINLIKNIDALALTKGSFWEEELKGFSD